MYEFGSIVLVPFPFTDLSATKVRPALIVSKPVEGARDVVVCFITSQEMPAMPQAVPLAVTKNSGLKVPSTVRFDKIATLDRRIILGDLGRIDTRTLRTHKRRFYGVFGF